MTRAEQAALRLRALQCRGFTLREIANRTGVTSTGLREILQHRYQSISDKSFEGVTKAWNELRDQSGQTHQANYIRNMAANKGWSADPDVAELEEKVTEGEIIREEDEFFKSWGYSDEEIADRLHITINQLWGYRAGAARMAA